MSKRICALTLLTIFMMGLFAACSSEEEATATPEPAAEIALKILGKTKNKTGWAEEEIRAMDAIEVTATNSKGEADTYTGVPITTLLDVAGVQTDVTTVVFVADDGFTSEVPLADVQACADCIVSFRSKGGFSTVMPGFPGNAQVKGVVEIQLE